MDDLIRDGKGQFKKGTSGNSGGRPPGSRNKSTVACEQLLDGQSEQLTAKLLEMALDGNIQALRMCMDRAIPARKERCINLELRPIANLQDLPIQFQDITSAIGDGRITPGEGESLSNILTSHAQTMERVNTDQRIAALEEHLMDVRDCRREGERCTVERHRDR